MSRLFDFQASASSKMYMSRATKTFFRVGDVKSKTISLGHLKFDLVSKIDAKGIESLPQTQIFECLYLCNLMM